MINNLEPEFIDELIKEGSFTTSRSGGKGGQNVNKVETKVEFSFDVINSDRLSPEQKTLIFEKLSNRIDKTGILKITSQEARTQLLNKDIALKKFRTLLLQVLKKEKIRKKTKPSFGDKENRIKEKKIVSGKKQSRKINPKDID
ncbi:alternative ribosome rescue aminoacyl-tRNA hydrolase ArfB [soil metagenome]